MCVAEAMRFATRGGKAPEGVLPRGQMAELWRWEGLYRHLTHDLPGALVAYDKARRAGLGWSRGGACRGSRASRARSPPLPTRTRRGDAPSFGAFPSQHAQGHSFLVCLNSHGRQRFVENKTGVGSYLQLKY